MAIKRKKLNQRRLLGDRVTSLLNSLGAERVAGLLEKVGKRPCNCKERRDALNRWHLKMIAAIEEIKDND